MAHLLLTAMMILVIEISSRNGAASETIGQTRSATPTSLLLRSTLVPNTVLLQVSTLESLEIPAFIGTKVDSATQRTREALHAGRAGDYQFAVKQARAARVDAEVALTHHAIASQHSYPFQHKIAVYLPLFAPLSLPIMAAVYVEVRHRLHKRKE